MADHIATGNERAFCWGQESWLEDWDDLRVREFEAAAVLIFGAGGKTYFQQGRTVARRAEQPGIKKCA